MKDDSSQEPKVAIHWDVYWTGTHEKAAHQDGGTQEEVLEHFWGDLFQRQLGSGGSRKLLDLACGNGAVTGFALQAAPQSTVFCLDYSVSAVLELRKRHPDALCVAADALRAPFTSGSFDIVFSQFGIEYAGFDTIDEAARLVAPNGVFAAVMHLRDGAIDRECTDNLQAIDAISQSQLLPLARDAFNAGFALNAGSGSVEAFKTAEKRFAPAIGALEKLLKERGSDIAAGLARQIYQDIAHMYQRMSKFDQNEVIAWVDGMILQLEAYRGRMSSMIDAALDTAAIQQLEDRMVSQDLTPKLRRTLDMGAKLEPAAWVLVCERG